MKETLTKIAREFGTPAFVYFFDRIAAQVAALRQAFDGLWGVSYAMKCNPNLALVERMKSIVDTLDISSGGELAKAQKVGWPGDRISFTGPAKTHAELQAAADHGAEVVLESLAEARQLNALARAKGRTLDVLIRIAPAQIPKGFGSHMTGKAAQFGIDEEVMDQAIPLVKELPNLRLCGFHCYSGTQCLKPDAVAENYVIFIDIFRRACVAHNIVPRKLIFGSGLGIPYHEGDQPIALAQVAERIVPAVRDFKADARFGQARLLLETGRFLVGEAGVYLTRVLRRKDSRGARIGVVDGGMHHQLAASGHLGMVIHKPYRMFKVCSDRPDGAEQTYDLYGCLCTSIDHLGKGIKFPGLEESDVIGIHCSGAYGVTSSPVNFISHPLPREFMVATKNGAEVIEDVTE